MGQYYYVSNLDKQEFLHPHKLGDGLKLLEFGCSADGTMTALALLLADGNGRGGGDHPSDSPLIGSWAGDRIVIAGDYADPLRWIENTSKLDREAVAKEHFSEGYQDADQVNLHHWADDHWIDISERIREVMKEDACIAEGMSEPWGVMTG